MKSSQTQNKRQAINYLVLTGLLLGAVVMTSLPSAMAESDPDVKMSDIDKLYDALYEQYDAVLESYGLATPTLTEAQHEELDKKLAPLDAEYEKIFGNYE